MGGREPLLEGSRQLTEAPLEFPSSANRTVVGPLAGIVRFFSCHLVVYLATDGRHTSCGRILPAVVPSGNANPSLGRDAPVP